MDRLRRLALVFLTFGLVLPLAPHLLGFPHGRSCFDSRIGEGECGFGGLGALLVAASLRAYVAARVGEEWKVWLWLGIAFVTLDVFLIPLEVEFMPHWYWDGFR